MKDEFDSMYADQIWNLVDLPQGRRAMGNKWVLKIKKNMDGTPDRCKARFAANGIHKKKGIDHKGTFSTVDGNQSELNFQEPKDPLFVPSGPITRARAKKIREAMASLVEKAWTNGDPSVHDSTIGLMSIK